MSAVFDAGRIQGNILRALSLSAQHLAIFPTEFRDGMTVWALKLGDTGDSAPAQWLAPVDAPTRVHLVASVNADDAADLGPVQRQVARDGRTMVGGKVFFDYVDGISRSRFAGADDPDKARVDQPLDPLSTFLLGHPACVGA